jgi:type VI secretion system protein ImpH
MAERHRRPKPSLIEDLFARPHRYELLQAISLLERVDRGAVPIGQGIDPEFEAVRLEQEPGLAFAPSDVSSLKRGEDGLPPVLRTPVIGMGGVNGPIPYAFTETLVERSARRDTAMGAFFNIFNHRIVSLFYRVRTTTEPLLSRSPDITLVADVLRAMVGIGTPGLARRLDGIGDRALLGHAALLADRRRSALGLRAMLAGIFRANVEVLSFRGRWQELEPGSLTRLGRSGDTGTGANRLGEGALLGRRIWDQHAAYVVSIRTDDLARYQEFLPSGRHFRPLVSLCRFYAGEVMDVVVELRLARKAIPPLKLSATEGSRLGWTSWLSAVGGRATRGGESVNGRVRLVARMGVTQ